MATVEYRITAYITRAHHQLQTRILYLGKKDS